MLTVWSFSYGFGSGRLLGLTWDLPGLSCGPLGGSWRLLGGLLGLAWATWAPLGASWGVLGTLLGLLGGSWRLLGSLLGLAWPTWAPLGASWGLLGTLMGPLAGLAPPWESLGTCLAHHVGLLGDWGWRCISLWGRLVQAGYTFGCTRLGVGDCRRCGAGSCRPVTLLLIRCVHRHTFSFDYMFRLNISCIAP